MMKISSYDNVEFSENDFLYKFHIFDIIFVKTTTP